MLCWFDNDEDNDNGDEDEQRPSEADLPPTLETAELSTPPMQPLFVWTRAVASLTSIFLPSTMDPFN